MIPKSFGIAFTVAPPACYTNILYTGWVNVGWHRRCKRRQSRRELDNQGTVFFLLAVAIAGGRARSFVRGADPKLRTREMIVSTSVYLVYGKAPTRKLHCLPTAGSGNGHTGKQII